MIPLEPVEEDSFIESVTKTSLALSSALDTGPAPEVVTGRHQAAVLEKLVHTGEREEEI
jgi:hypothetical protein